MWVGNICIGGYHFANNFVIPSTEHLDKLQMTVVQFPLPLKFFQETLVSTGFKLVKRIQGFSCSTGSACHANECKPSRILLNFHIVPEVAANTLRISTGRETTICEIEEVITELKLMIPN